jgi:hypothetical protein
MNHDASESTCNVPYLERQSMRALKFEAIAADRDVSSKVIEVNNNTKMKFKDVDPSTGRRRSLQAKIEKVKQENGHKGAAYVKSADDALHIYI